MARVKGEARALWSGMLVAMWPRMTLALATLVLVQGVGCACDVAVEITDFGDNPGGLRHFEYVPPDVGDDAPLLVMLHGCAQSHDVISSAGVVELADEAGFVVLAPEQGVLNNGNLCFNWFQAEDQNDSDGEAASIHAMVESVRSRHDIDASQIVVAGLSAGAAMAMNLAAIFPDLISGAASLAGGPAGCAKDVVEAAGCLAGTTTGSGAFWADKARALVNDNAGDVDTRTRWPRIMVLQGSDDLVVNPAAADAIVSQWLTLHGVSADDAEDDAVTDNIAGSSAGDIIVSDFFAVGADVDAPVVTRVIMEGVDHTLPIDDVGCGHEAAFVRDLDFCALGLVIERFFSPR